jgi:hypothetical protein
MATTADDVWQLLAELTAAQKETDRQLKELGKQIGGLGRANASKF